MSLPGAGCCQNRNVLGTHESLASGKKTHLGLHRRVAVERALADLVRVDNWAGTRETNETAHVHCLPVSIAFQAGFARVQGDKVV